MLKAFGILMILLSAAGSVEGQRGESPAMPYFKINRGADKVAPAFNWWFELTPPPEYERWWHEIATCEKLPLPDQYRTVRWFAVNTRMFAPAPELGDTADIAVTALAYNWQAGPEIWLTVLVHNVEWLVKHEMVHQLMKWADEPPGHPPERFGICGLYIFYDPFKKGGK